MIKLKEWCINNNVSYNKMWRQVNNGTFPYKTSMQGKYIMVNEQEKVEVVSDSLNEDINSPLAIILKKSVEYGQKQLTIHDFVAFLVSNFTFKPIKRTKKHKVGYQNVPVLITEKPIEETAAIEILTNVDKTQDKINKFRSRVADIVTNDIVGAYSDDIIITIDKCIEKSIKINDVTLIDSLTSLSDNELESVLKGLSDQERIRIDEKKPLQDKMSELWNLPQEEVKESKFVGKKPLVCKALSFSRGFENMLDTSVEIPQVVELLDDSINFESLDNLDSDKEDKFTAPSFLKTLVESEDKTEFAKRAKIKFLKVDDSQVVENKQKEYDTLKAEEIKNKVNAIVEKNAETFNKINIDYTDINSRDMAKIESLLSNKGVDKNVIKNLKSITSNNKPLIGNNPVLKGAKYLKDVNSSFRRVNTKVEIANKSNLQELEVTPLEVAVKELKKSKRGVKQRADIKIVKEDLANLKEEKQLELFTDEVSSPKS